MRHRPLSRAGAPLALLVTLGLSVGCGESFTATGDSAGGGGTTATTTDPGGAGGTAGAGGSQGGSGGAGGGGECETGLTQPCYTGPEGTKGVGICKGGTQECVNGAWSACFEQVKPGTESCDAGSQGAQDEDCDGETDEGCTCSAGTQQACYSGPPDTVGTGQCASGVQTCEGNAWSECKGEVLPAAEECDLDDNDCDGKADNLETPCIAEEKLGECRKGNLFCNAAQDAECAPSAPAAEICDNLDNDCDGVVDNFPTNQGVSCMVGACPGLKTCFGGELICMLPYEVCGNGIDDNCDGVKDPVNAPLSPEGFNNGNQNGWLLGQQWAIGGAQASFGAVAPFFDDPDTDTTLTADDNIAGVVLGGFATTDIHDPYYLTSPVLNTSGVQGALYLRYRRWLNSDYPPYMSSTVEVYDGAKWVVIWNTPTENMNGGGVHDSEWKTHVLDVTPFKNPNFRVRFGTAVMAIDAYEVSSWNIDDLALITCVPPELAVDPL